MIYFRFNMIRNFRFHIFKNHFLPFWKLMQNKLKGAVLLPEVVLEARWVLNQLSKPAGFVNWSHRLVANRLPTTTILSQEVVCK